MSRDGSRPPDATRVTEQPALTRSTGRIWLVVGGIALVVYGGVLVAVTRVSLTAPLFAVLLDLVLYAAMVAVRVVLPPGRGRLGVLAGLFLGMSFVSLAALVAVILAAPTP